MRGNITLKIASCDVDLTAHERAIDRIECDNLLLGQDTSQVDVSVLGEPTSFNPRRR